jgi:YidC/Oxa1 family membrane protein insertase
MIFRPLFDNAGYETEVYTDKILAIDLKPASLALNPGEERVLSAMVYIGPESKDILKEYEGGVAEIKRFYRWDLFDAIAKLIHSIMHALHRVFPNWGVVVVVLSVIIYFSTYPLTLKGMSSMKKMQALQPKMTALREKHKNSPEKLNKEIMELYKEHKINPMGGCLPFLLQMPIFIGLYQVLWRDVSLKGAKFLWIKDLSEPDRLFVLKGTYPVIGNEINILPVLMAIVMAYQQKVQAQSMVLTDPQQIAQQKMMAKIMPVFIGFIFYHFASGLALYFTLFYVFSTLTQIKMNKKTATA